MAKYEHNDSIPCDAECQNVTHEPISVCGPTDADNASVEPRFGQDKGKPTTAIYDYEGQLDLDGEDCDLEICDADDDNFQAKGSPLQVGFFSEEDTGPDPPGPGEWRWAFAARATGGGDNAYYGAVVGGTAHTHSYFITPTETFSTDTDGFTWAFTMSTSGSSDFSSLLYACPSMTSLGLSATANFSFTLNRADTIRYKDPSQVLFSFEGTYATQTANSDFVSLIGDPRFVSGRNNIGSSDTTDQCVSWEPPILIFNTLQVSSLGITDTVGMRTNAPFPLTVDNWEEVRDNWH